MTDANIRLICDALDDIKASDIQILDVTDISSITDFMIIATGRSSRQVQALADNVAQRCKAAGMPPLGTEGKQSGEWVLIDLGDYIVHVMTAQAREFYDLERLWGSSPKPANMAVSAGGGDSEVHTARDSD